MKKRNFRVLVCAVILFVAIAMTACADETDTLQERIDTLETENAELQSTISSLRTDLERAQADYFRVQNELQYLQSAQEAAEEQAAIEAQGGPLAITFYGQPHTDRSWPLRNGDFNDLGLRVNIADFSEETEIVWRSTNENVFIVTPSEDGLSATLTPLATGRAQVVVTVGDQETRSDVSIT